MEKSRISFVFLYIYMYWLQYLLSQYVVFDGHSSADHISNGFNVLRVFNEKTSLQIFACYFISLSLSINSVRKIVRANTSIEVRYINFAICFQSHSHSHSRLHTQRDSIYTINIIRCMVIIKNNKAGQLPKNFVFFY